MKYIYEVNTGGRVYFWKQIDADKCAGEFGGTVTQVAVMDSFDEYKDVRRQSLRMRALSKLTAEERDALTINREVRHD